MNPNHAIRINSIQNARELGGYRTADGRRIKDGVLLRTASLKGISAEDILLLTDTYRLRHIVDFRMDMELPGAEDPPIKDAAYHHLNVIDMTTLAEQEDIQMDAGVPELVLSVKLSEQIGAFDGRMYIGFLAASTGKKAYADFFRILLSADPDHAVLWHCTGGKDRTGLAAMLLLTALGVDEETIIRDYLLTNTFNAQKIAETERHLKAEGYDDGFIRKAVLVLHAVDERSMRSAIAWLKKEYRSVDGYIRDALQITQAEIDSLKEKYLV